MQELRSLPQIDAEAVPIHKRERLARSLIKIVKAAFENPKIQEEFEEWQKKQQKSQ